MFDANFDATTLQALDLKGLSKGAVTELAAALLAQLSAQGTQLSAQHAALQAKDEHIARRDCEIRFKDTKIERITFELARLKAWKFGARTERMNAEQRQMFEETAAEDEARPAGPTGGVARCICSPRTTSRRQQAPAAPPAITRTVAPCRASPRT